MGDAIPSTLGARIYQLRVDKGWTMLVLAKRARVTATFVNDVEKGKRWPSAAVLDRFATALRVDSSDLQWLDERPPMRQLRERCKRDAHFCTMLRRILREKVTGVELEIALWGKPV
jgi:transcriptional regulator with XRE-family HTH domain